MQESSGEEQVMTMTQAIRYLGVSPRKMSALIREKVIEYSIDPLDNRRKLLKVRDLDELKRRSLGKE